MQDNFSLERTTIEVFLRFESINFFSTLHEDVIDVIEALNARHIRPQILLVHVQSKQKLVLQAEIFLGYQYKSPQIYSTREYFWNFEKTLRGGGHHGGVTMKQLSLGARE